LIVNFKILGSVSASLCQRRAARVIIPSIPNSLNRIRDALFVFGFRVAVISVAAIPRAVQPVSAGDGPS